VDSDPEKMNRSNLRVPLAWWISLTATIACLFLYSRYHTLFESETAFFVDFSKDQLFQAGMLGQRVEGEHWKTMIGRNSWMLPSISILEDRGSFKQNCARAAQFKDADISNIATSGALSIRETDLDLTGQYAMQPTKSIGKLLPCLSFLTRFQTRNSGDLAIADLVITKWDSSHPHDAQVEVHENTMLIRGRAGKRMAEVFGFALAPQR
jgi:hypothetical protein